MCAILFAKYEKGKISWELSTLIGRCQLRIFRTGSDVELSMLRNNRAKNRRGITESNSLFDLHNLFYDHHKKAINAGKNNVLGFLYWRSGSYRSWDFGSDPVPIFYVVKKNKNNSWINDFSLKGLNQWDRGVNKIFFINILETASTFLWNCLFKPEKKNLWKIAYVNISANLNQIRNYFSRCRKRVLKIHQSRSPR